MKKESKDIISCVPSMQDTTSYYQPFMCDGKKITCVFENPTWLEELLQRPVAGIAGSRLCVLFKILRNMMCRLRDDYSSQLYRHRVCIVNGARKVSSKSIKKDYRGLAEKNIATLKDAVLGSSLVICFGKNAQKAFNVTCRSLKKDKAEAISDIQSVEVYHLCGTAYNRLSVLDGLMQKYNLSEHLRGMVGLIVIAEYLATWYDMACCHKKMMPFSEFSAPFRKGGKGLYKGMFKVHTINFKTMLSCTECSASCCRNCGSMGCWATSRHHTGDHVQ